MALALFFGRNCDLARPGWSLHTLRQECQMNGIVRLLPLVGESVKLLLNVVPQGKRKLYTSVIFKLYSFSLQM